MRSSAPSGPAAWARCIAPATHGSTDGRDQGIGRRIASATHSMRQRFEREARAVAALSHPHICHLNDVGHDDGVDFLVMEYLEGETLAARLAQRSVAARRRNSQHAIQIAEALNAAHRARRRASRSETGQRHAHEDGRQAARLRPGEAAAGKCPGGVGVHAGPTKENPLTDEGAVLGTWPYMSPEQVEGKVVDARSDIFSFGAMLYEMATGTRAFAGDSHASLIAAILERDPIPLSARQSAAPPALDRVVRKCLAKLPEARWQSARDLADALKWIAEERSSVSQPGTKADERTRPSNRWLWVAATTVALGLGLALGATSVWNLSRSVVPTASVRRFVIQPPANARMTNWEFTLSPDGSALVYEGRPAGLYLQSLDQRDARPIPGTEGGRFPTFSPDSQWIAFFVGDTLKKVSRSSGAPPITLAEFPRLIGSLDRLASRQQHRPRSHRGGAVSRTRRWGHAGQAQVPPDAGQGVIDHHNPRWLPGAKSLLITSHRGPETFDVAALDPETGETRVIVSDAFDAWYAASGHLVFARGQTLHAAPFDLTRLELTGPPVVMVDAIYTFVGDGVAAYAVSGDGLLAYVPAIEREERRLAWLGPDAAVDPLPVGPRGFWRPTLSPDGTRIAVEISEGARRDIWIYDSGSAALSQLTSDGASASPIWTPDGTRVTFSRIKDGRGEVYRQPADGTAPAERLVTDTFSVIAGSWSPDGRRLAFIREPPTEQADIGLFDVTARTATMTIATENTEQQARFSPNGRWLAYVTSETGRSEVVIASLDGTVRRRDLGQRRHRARLAPGWPGPVSPVRERGQQHHGRGRQPVPRDDRQAHAGREGWPVPVQRRRLRPSRL